MPYNGYMKTLLKNLTILTMKDKEPLFGDIGLDGKLIAFVGKDDSFQADTVIDMKGKVALPGFVNGHTHLAMTLLRNYKDTQPNLQAWLSEIFPIEDKMDDRAIFAGANLGIAELIKSGCTTYADMYFMAHQTIKASLDAGIRSVQGLTFFGSGDDARARIKERFPLMEKAASGSDLVRFDAAVHAIYTCTEECYKIGSEFARTTGGMLNTHLSETFQEVQDSLKAHGMSPVHYLNSLNIFSTPTYIAHGVHIMDDEFEVLKEHNVSIIHNPSSNLKLASGIAPIARYREYGINVGLGTDGASSNNNLSMLKEANLATLISTVTTKDPMRLTPFETLKMATIDGARALGLENKIGTLEKGKEADITILDLDRVNTTPINDPYSAIVYSADTSNVDTVYCQGRELLSKGKLKTIDEKKAIKEIKKECSRLYSL